MKYCVDFDTRFQYINEIDEIIIKYNKQKADALKYIQEHPKNCVILYIDNVEDEETKKELNKLSQIALEHPEFNFKVEFAEMIYNIQEYNYHFKYFFHTYVNTWDRFIGILNLGVSDIYIIDELGFELDKIAEIAHKNNVSIRCFANIAQSSWVDTPSIKKFFIRPEDISFYENFIDVIYFTGKIEEINIYYDIYKNDKKWFGKLNEIILNLDENDEIDLDSRYIIPRFAEVRVKCGKKCLKGNNCQICERIYELSQSLEKAKLIVRKKEEEK